jgi:hypothetical protein
LSYLSLSSLCLRTLHLACNLFPELTAAETAGSDTCSSPTKVTGSASRILENTTLGNSDSDLTSRRNTHGLHHFLDTDGVDYL